MHYLLIILTFTSTGMDISHLNTRSPEQCLEAKAIIDKANKENPIKMSTFCVDTAGNVFEQVN